MLEVIDEVLELFMDLDASDEQLDCPFVLRFCQVPVIAMRDLDDEPEGYEPAV